MLVTYRKEMPLENRVKQVPYQGPVSRAGEQPENWVEIPIASQIAMIVLSLLETVSAIRESLLVSLAAYLAVHSPHSSR